MNNAIRIQQYCESINLIVFNVFRKLFGNFYLKKPYLKKLTFEIFKFLLTGHQTHPRLVAYGSKSCIHHQHRFLSFLLIQKT